MNPEVEVTITAKGPTGSGKSLVISDLIASLREHGHFIVIDGISGGFIMSSDKEEIKNFKVRMRSMNPIEHEDC